MKTIRLTILTLLMASALILTVAALAEPKEPVSKKGKQTELSKTAKPAMETVRLKNKGISLSPGYQGVRQGQNSIAVYRNNSPTGMTMTCICASGSYCELKPPGDGGDFYRCEPHGCPDCQFIVNQPKGGMAAIFHAVNMRAPVKTQ